MRRQLFYYGLAFALPILAFAGFLLWQSAIAERTRLESDALATARAIAVAVDRELNGLVSALQVLALSPYLQLGDLEGFHRQATELSQRQGVNVVVRAPDGQQLVNVRRAYGEALPVSLPRGEVAEFDGRQPVISSLFTGPVEALPQFAVTVPVLRDKEVRYLVDLTLPVSRMREIILDASPPADWTVAIVDRDGIILAHNNRHDEFVGHRATQDLLDNTTGVEGTWSGFTIEGVPVFGAYARVLWSNWRVAVGVADATLNAPIVRSLWNLAGIGLVAVVLSALLGHLFGRKIIRPMQALAAEAAALGRGDGAVAVPTTIPEIRKVGETMELASRKLTHRETALRGLTDNLEAKVAERTAELVAANRRLVAAASEREQVEAQLRQAQKMEAVGQLTGGIAHDFNNMLAVVISGLTLVQRRLAKGEADSAETARLIDAAMDGASRAAALTQRLLVFSRQQPLAPEPIDANRLVADMSELLHRTLDESIRIELVLAEGLWTIHADPNQLENSLLNLAVNARDAMPDGGTLTIETANRRLEPPHPSDGRGAGAAEYVMIAVRDTGSGMPPEIAARAFDPFFTTKTVGKGTGLGLSQVYGFVTQSGGDVEIRSEPGRGTEVEIVLPRLAAAVDTTEQTAAAPLPAEGAGGELILVVEDEERVRELTVTALLDLGYAVLYADSANAALRQLDERPDIALLVTDVVMPGMSGRSLSEEAVRRHPGLKVLYMTGYARSVAARTGIGGNFLAKPFTVDQLARKIRAVLDAPAGPAPVA